LVVGRNTPEQHNNHNSCGPIAAITVRGILKNEDSLFYDVKWSSQTLRKVIIKDYKRLFTKFESILNIEHFIKGPERDQSVPTSPLPLELPLGAVTCPCCLDVLFPIDQQVLPCHHKFHLYCLLQWETSSGKTSCPLCREGFNDFENTKEATAYKTTAIKLSSAAITSPVASLPTPEAACISTCCQLPSTFR
jgi:hypothetical protein